MKKRVISKLASGILTACMLMTPIYGSAAQHNNTNSMDSLMAGKLCVLGSIANLQEVRQTLDYLESIGMQGAFVVSTQEARLYPSTVQMIVKRGHSVVLDMAAQETEAKPKQKPSSKVEEQSDKNKTLNRPVEKPIELKKDASSELRQGNKTPNKPVEKPIELKKDTSVAQKQENKIEVKKEQADTVLKQDEKQKSAVVSKEQQDDISSPLVMEHIGLDNTSFRERVARERQRRAAAGEQATDAEIKKAVKNNYYQPKENTALKVTGTTDKPSNVKVDKPVLTKKQRIARDFLGVDEKGNKVKLRYPASAKEIDDIPEWSLKSLVKLTEYKLLLPDEVQEMLSEPDRELMGKLISRAYNTNEAYKGEHYYDARFELDKLMQEYDTELRNLGYDAGRYASYNKLQQARATKIGGELRYNYVDHEGDNPFNFHDSRLRLRLYAEQPLDDNWVLYGMGEANKSWFQDIKHFSLERLYISGKYKDAKITAGRFGEFLADGNVYDGYLDGVSVEGGSKVKLRGDVGRLRSDEKVALAVASYSEPRFDAEAGVYHFDKLKGYDSTTIASLGGMYYIGEFGLGAMYLYSGTNGIDGSNNGYVITVKYGRNRSWVPGTYEIFAKYYNQADSTYVGHTMVGLADYMHGFKGFGAGLYYTLAENVIYGIEYYDLQEKSSGRKGRTLWNHVSVFF